MAVFEAVILFCVKTENQGSGTHMKFLSRDKQFYKTLLTLTCTIALQNIVVNAVGLADNVMLGGYSENALSGVSLANQIQFVLQMVVLGLGEGLIIIGSQYWGKRETLPIKKIINIGLVFAVVTALLFFVVVFSFPNWAMSLFTNDQAVIEQGAIYLKIVCFSYLFFCVTNTLLNGLKAVETVKVGLLISVVALVVNVCLNYCLIYGRLGFPRMGTAGAAIATLASRIVETLIVVAYYIWFDKKLRYKLRELLLLDGTLVRDYIRVGTPVVLSNAMWGVAMGIQSSILGHLGGPIIAANAIASNIFGVISVAAYGCSGASSVVIGKTIGSGASMDKLKEYVRSMQVIFLCIGVLSGTALFVARDAIIALFSVSGQTLVLARQFATVLSVTLVGTSYQVACLTGIVRGGGDTKFVLYNDFIFMWCIVLPLSAMAAYWWNWPPVAVFICLKCDQVLKCFVAIFKLNSYNWVRNLTR